MKGFFAALGFLTAIPLPQKLRGGAIEISSAAPYFPLVGLVIGIFVFCVYTTAGYFLPPLLACAIVALAMSWISGGLHIDGLADTADGFLGGTGRERIIAIMKDSRTGAFGAFAIVTVVAIKIAAVQSLTAPFAVAALILSPVAARFAMTSAMSSFPYVSGEGGLGHAFNSGLNKNGLAMALITFIGASAFAGLNVMTGLVILTVASVFLFGAYCKSRLGGMTGDTYGALCEITETLSLIFFVSLG